MNDVCCSVSEVLKLCYEDMRKRLENTERDLKIYGCSNFIQRIITEKQLGVRPVLSGNIISESAPEIINTSFYGNGRYGHIYRIKDDVRLGLLKYATKDDLYLFVTMANPEILKDEKLKSTLLNRLTEVHEQELSAAGENAAQVEKQLKIDRRQFEFILNELSAAIQPPHDPKSYYSQYYQIIDMQLAKKTILAYDKLGVEARKALNTKYERIANKMYEDFYNICKDDPELIADSEELLELKRILQFDRQSKFEVRTGVINGDDPEFRDIIYSYSPEYEADARNAALNWTQIESELTGKINKVKNSKLPFSKDKRIQRLRDELYHQSQLRDKYLYVEERDRKKAACIENGGEKRLKQLEHFIARRQRKLAQKVTAQYMSENPAILCTELPFKRISSCCNNISISGEILSDYITDLRSMAANELIRDAEVDQDKIANDESSITVS